MPATPAATLDLSWLPNEATERGVREILEQCARQETSPAITLLRLMFTSSDEADLRGLMQFAGKSAADSSNPALSELCALYEENKSAYQRIAALPETPPVTDSMSATEQIERLRSSFDSWVQKDAPLSVALYTFGNDRLIHKATRELVDALDDWRLLGPEVDALQIGCGSGRVESLLCRKVRSAWGIDISANMIRAARSNLSDAANVRFAECSGQDLAGFEAGSFDLVYAVDSFPYIVEIGDDLVERHFQEVGRVLRNRGHFVIFHYSYRDDPERDNTDVRRFAATHGFKVIREAVTPFTVWNGVAYHLQKAK